MLSGWKDYFRGIGVQHARRADHFAPAPRAKLAVCLNVNGGRKSSE